MPENEHNLSIYMRLWLYQKERFPVFKHGLLIAAFSSSAVCLSALLRGQTAFPEPEAFVLSFLVLFLLFFQLRVADEFKDAEEDAKFRPERAVPRGLVSLKELAAVGIIAGIFQLTAVLAYFPALALILLIVWGYMALMSAEFFVPVWLKSRPFLYMISHMLIMPLIDLFATACDWLVQVSRAPDGLIWFLIVSFFNGAIIEIGRKTWAPSMEKQGVESYSSSWGLEKALIVWSIAILGSFACAVAVSVQIDFLIPAVSVLSLMMLWMVHTVLQLLKHKDGAQAKALENVSGLWVFCIYLFLGIIPMGVKVWL